MLPCCLSLTPCQAYFLELNVVVVQMACFISCAQYYLGSFDTDNTWSDICDVLNW
jgi:hypothetical protein